ncbi:MAG: hypothetical protein U9R16_08940, partial [Campylobacterota bacterium]|nr:hypothetical protein [Campylobacterota bacterium]
MEKIYKSIVFKVLAFLISLYTVFGFVLLPYLIQTNFTKTVKSFTSANGYMEKIYINPYTFEVEISNLLIQDDKNKTLLYFSKFSFDFKFYSLFTKRIVVDTIYLKDLKSNIILDKNKIFNFQYIIDFISKNSEIESKANSETNSSMIGLVIEDIKLLDNRVVFVDNSKSTPFELNTDKFDIKLKHISILPNGDGS